MSKQRRVYKFRMEPTSRLETGRAEPCLGTIRMIAKALKIALSDLFKGL